MRLAKRHERRSWWLLHGLFAWLNLSLTAPIIYVYVGLPMVMREHGWSGSEIGFLQLAGLPAILKFLMATPIDRYPLGQGGYRNWAMLLGACYAGALGWFSAHDLAHTSVGLLFLISALVNVLASWADIPVNALAIQMLPPEERIRAGSVRSAATSLGAIVGGGVMLLLQTRWGWAAPFYVLAGCMLAGVMLLVFLKPGRRHAVVRESGVRADWRDWLSYFKTPPHGGWALLLLLYFPFIGAAWVYLKPLLIDQGFAPPQIALLVGMGGGAVAVIGSLAGSRLTRWLGAALALPLYALAALAALGALTVALYMGTHAFIFISAMAIALTMGAMAGLIFGLMMHYARPGLAAIDYGIQSSLFICARTMVPMVAGVLLDQYGHAGLMAGLLAGSALAFLLALRGRRFAMGFVQDSK